MVNIDWVVAMGVFLVFTVWAFAFYSQVFSAEGESVSEALDLISDKIVENLTVRVHYVPVIANVSNISLSSKVLYFEYRWPFGKNTTKILKDGVSQTCNITGNRIYWQSSLAAFRNYFTMKYSEQEANLSCTGGFSVVNETQVIPFAAEEGEEISRARINSMGETSYSVFKSNLGISRDFNVTIENSSATLLSYGLPPPRATDVFSKAVRRQLEETGENITLRFLVW
jgi:hypothetical protein